MVYFKAPLNLSGKSNYSEPHLNRGLAKYSSEPLPPGCVQLSVGTSACIVFLTLR